MSPYKLSHSPLMVIDCIKANPNKTAKELADILSGQFLLKANPHSVEVSIHQMYKAGKFPSVIREEMPYGAQRFSYLSDDTDDPSNREVAPSHPASARLSPHEFNEIQERIIPMLVDRGYFEDHRFDNVSDVVKWLLNEGIARNEESLYALFGEDFLHGL